MKKYLLVNDYENFIIDFIIDWKMNRSKEN
jgi:hypothetical protein